MLGRAGSQELSSGNNGEPLALEWPRRVTAENVVSSLAALAGLGRTIPAPVVTRSKTIGGAWNLEYLA
jgi:hypothetical protein